MCKYVQEDLAAASVALVRAGHGIGPADRALVTLEVVGAVWHERGVRMHMAPYLLAACCLQARVCPPRPQEDAVLC